MASGKGGKWENYVENYTGTEIPQVEHTYAYHHAVFGYMNEHQLAITESTIGCQGKMRNPTPSAVMDITTLTMIAMERCTTAREAVKLMGELGEKYGYGYHDSGEMLGVADSKEVWLFEIMPVGPLWTPKSKKPGAVWCAQRVPDDHVSFCPNESRIGEIDLNNSDYFLASPNVKSLAVDMGFYDPEQKEPFSWKKAYSPTEASAESSQGRRARLWRLYDMVAPSKNFQADIPNMDLPFSVKPDKTLSVADIMAMTRDKYQGTEFDPARGILGGPFKNPNYFESFESGGQRYNGPRCICVNKVEYTTITQCRDWLPDPVGGVIWLSFGAQDTACYMPLYAGITRLPDSFSIGDHWVFDRESARWAFDYVDFHTQVAYSYAIQDVIREQNRWETQALERIPVLDSFAQDLYKKDQDLASQFLTDYCVNHAESLIKAWWDLGDQLLVKYNHFRVYDTENRTVKSIAPSEEWRRTIVLKEKLKPAQKRR
ncbi:dipeptidase [Acidobacteriota bacterium]